MDGRVEMQTMDIVLVQLYDLITSKPAGVLNELNELKMPTVFKLIFINCS